MLWTKEITDKNNRLECPYQDSNLGRRGIAKPQHDDLTTNLYGPKYRGVDEVQDQSSRRGATMVEIGIGV